MQVSTSTIVMSPVVKQEENDKGTISGATASPNLHLPILDGTQYITLSDAGQHSTRMRCYFHYQFNCFIDYFDDQVPDGKVIYAGDVPFWYNEQEGMYTEFWGNPTGYIFMAARRDKTFLLNHRGSTLHVSSTPIESRNFNHDYISNSHFSSTTHMPVSSLDSSDP